MYKKIEDVFSNCKNTKVLRKGDWLCKQGNKAQYIFYVENGSFIKFKNDSRKRSFIIDFASEHSVIGLSAIEQGTYQYNIKALSNANAIALSLDHLNFILENNFELRFWTISQLCRKVNLLQEEAITFFNKNNTQKLAHILLKLTHCFELNTKSEAHMRVALPSKEISTLLGINEKKLFGILSHFKSEGILDFQGNTLKMLNEKLIKSVIFG